MPRRNVIAPWIGGTLVVEIGWRHTFAGLGLAGIPLALLVLALLRNRAGARQTIWKSCIRRTLRRGVAAVVRTSHLPAPDGTLILMAIAEYTMILWMPSLFHRSFGVDTAALGAKLAIYQGVPFFLGTGSAA